MKQIEYSNKSRFMHVPLKRCVQQDDFGKLKRKYSYHTRHSNENTYHVANKNIASSKFTDGLKMKERMPSGASPSLGFWLSLDYLGVPWASPSLGSFHSLFQSPSNPYPKLENFTTQNFNRKSHELR